MANGTQETRNGVLYTWFNGAFYSDNNTTNKFDDDSIKSFYEILIILSGVNNEI